MKVISIILKSLREQIRSYWVLLLTLSLGPFFIFVYFLILEGSETHYTVLILNKDRGYGINNMYVNHGAELLSFFNNFTEKTPDIPLTVKEISDSIAGIENLKNKKADALIIINDSFSSSIELKKTNDSTSISQVDFIGDLTSADYLISAVWANELFNDYALNVTRSSRVIIVKESALGTSGSASSFDIIVPGILILSLIMLIFTASIAFVSEVENRTIMRLKLSKLTAFEFLSGISAVQLAVGISSVLLTLLTAILLGFSYEGSLSIMLFVASLTSISIIAFSLIIVSLTKSASEVLVVGNFPMFLFMFFTGAAFPLKNKELFTIAGYPVNIQGLMTPTHAISALNKTLLMKMDFPAIIPEIIAILILTIIYFIIGGMIFKYRHLKLD